MNILSVEGFCCKIRKLAKYRTPNFGSSDAPLRRRKRTLLFYCVGRRVPARTTKDIMTISTDDVQASHDGIVHFSFRRCM
jgi:hypothetical protein